MPQKRSPKCIPQENWGAKPMYTQFNYGGLNAGDLLEVKNYDHILPKFKYEEY